MSEIELGTLPDRLDDDEVALVMSQLREHLGDPEFALPAGDISASGNVIDELDGELLAEFMDRLEVSDLGCEYYLPVEFDGKLDCGDYCVGSLYSLVEALEEMMDDLDIEDVEDDLDDIGDEDDYASDLELLTARMRILWRTYYDAAGEAIDADLALIIVR